MLNVLQIIKVGASAAEFVKGGGLDADLGALELTAARQALRNLQSANDQRSQLWSVINHLETAEAAYVRSTGRDMFTATVRRFARDVAFGQLFLVRCIIAVCYLYLSEDELCRQTVERMRNMLRDETAMTGAEVAGTLLHIFSGMVLVNLVTTKADFVSTSELQQHYDALEKFVRSNGIVTTAG